MSRLFCALALTAAMLLLPVLAGEALAAPPEAGAGVSTQEPDRAQAGATDEDPDKKKEETDGVYSESLAALTKLLVLAVLLESALSIIFNWRVFLTYFSLSGVKTIIMIVVSYLFVSWFDIDIVADLIKAYQPDAQHKFGLPTQLITALILAGGSAGVYNVMRALGYRSGNREQEVNPRPPKTEAWIAVWAKRDEAVGEIFVKLRKMGKASGRTEAPIAGVIGNRRPRLWELLFRNRNRFPQNGGYSVEPDTVYELTVESTNAAGDEVVGLKDKYVFAAGAIVDFEVTI